MRDFDFFTIVIDLVLLAVVLQGRAMTSPRPYYAAGTSWLIGRSGGRKQPTLDPVSPFLRFDDVRRVKFQTGRRGANRSPVKLVHFQDVHDRAWAFKLMAFQSCPPMVALIDPVLDRHDVTVEGGVREALHASPGGSGDPKGRTVFRAGSGL